MYLADENIPDAMVFSFSFLSNTNDNHINHKEHCSHSEYTLKHIKCSFKEEKKEIK